MLCPPPAPAYRSPGRSLPPVPACTPAPALYRYRRHSTGGRWALTMRNPADNLVRPAPDHPIVFAAGTRRPRCGTSEPPPRSAARSPTGKPPPGGTGTHESFQVLNLALLVWVIIGRLAHRLGQPAER